MKKTTKPVQTAQNSASVSVSEELQKKISDLGGFSFADSKFQELVKKQKEREFPDYGRDVPEGVYTLTGQGNIHQWKSPRTEAVSDIVVVYLTNESNEVFEVAAASFATREWSFMQQQGKDNNGKMTYAELSCKPILPFISSVADRNAAVGALTAGTKVRVKHSNRGHFDNPNNTRIWDFIYTYVENV